MFDTHCHLTFKQFAGRTKEILDAAESAGVRGAITISTTSADAERALAVARSDERVWCSAGVHPLHSDEPIDWDAIRRVGTDPRCVAWGELGLDRHYAEPTLDVQRRVLDEQLALIERWSAEGLGKPVVVHCREAFDELVPILDASALPNDRFVFHCFTAGPAEARAVLDFGAMISFTGVVTFRNAPEVAEVARLVPDDRIMVETDAPFLSPEPVRTTRPNEPRFVVHVAERIAELRGVDPAAFEAIADANATRFFGLPG